MRLWLSALVAVFLPFVSAPAQESQPFPGTAPVTFYFKESLKDKAVLDPDALPEDETYIVATERSLLIGGSAPLDGFDLSTIDGFTQYSIAIGDFDSGSIQDLQGTLGDDETFDPETETSVVIPINALDSAGDWKELGTLSLNWNNDRVEFQFQIDNANQALTFIEHVVAADFYRDTDDPAIDGETLEAAFSFGPFLFDSRTVYTIGTASTSEDERVGEALSEVRLFGAIDSVPPVVTITSPKPGASTTEQTVTFTGTVMDKRQIKTEGSTVATFDGEIASVEVRVGAADFEEATITGSTWVFPDVALEAGSNKYQVRAIDVHGNVTTTAERSITLSARGSITVQAEAVGFPAEASGPAGTVSGAFLSNTSNKITALIGQPFVSLTTSNVTAGQQFTVVATPAPGAVFDGWTATLDGIPQFTTLTEKLTFETRPKLVLRATFVPNPFDPIFGTYHGLVEGDGAAERGTVKIGISKTGAFTGKLSAGALTLPIRGNVTGSGRWEGVVKKGLAEYAITFDMNVSGVGDRILTGTITGPSLSAQFAGDLKDWRKPRGSDPGKLATEYAGTYNVLLTAPADPNVPAGTGFGRVTITTLGAVRFVGKLGDSSKASAGATLVERVSGGVTFPLFIALDKKQGNIAGTVTYSVAPSSDLTATLEWSEPATTAVEPQAFSTQVSLAGSRYLAPTAGALAILGGTGGSGFIELTLPAYSLPVTPAGQGSEPSAAATLNPQTHSVTLAPSISTDALAFKMKIATKTGLFTGSFKDPQLAKTIPFSGAVMQKPNGGLGIGGGVFARGNRAGAIFFGPPPPP